MVLKGSCIDSIPGKLLSCAGYYCGRSKFSNGNISECGSCPRGYKVDSAYMCAPCDDPPAFYDWLFLIFTVLVPLMFQCYYIDCKTRTFKMNVLYISAFIEIAYSALCTLLLMNPIGTFKLKSCRVVWLSDWYTLLYNPSPNYEDTIFCTQEAVYPLYSMIFVFYAINVVMLMLIRSWFIRKAVDVNSAISTLYAGLYLYPILAAFHAVFAGLIYYSFPYITLAISMIVNAVHFADIPDQSVTNLVRKSLRDPRDTVIVLSIWASNVFAIVGITQLTEPVTHYMYLSMAPLPTIFYILTSNFTDPRKIHNNDC